VPIYLNDAKEFGVPTMLEPNFVTKEAICLSTSWSSQYALITSTSSSMDYRKSCEDESMEAAKATVTTYASEVSLVEREGPLPLLVLCGTMAGAQARPVDLPPSIQQKKCKAEPRGRQKL
jgi:hypothetical protein